MQTKALVTVNVGGFLCDNVRESLQEAARRWGADYVEVRAACGGVHPSAMKLLVFELTEAERVAVVDADAIIRDSTPDLFAVAAEESRFYAVRNEQPHHPGMYQQANPAIAREEIGRISAQRLAAGKSRALPEGADVWRLSREFFNAGVWVATRRYHQALLAEAFEDYRTTAGLQWWDQMPLNLAVCRALGGYAELGVAWNYQFPDGHPQGTGQQMGAYIYHYAGDPGRYEKLKYVRWGKKAEGKKAEKKAETWGQKDDDPQVRVVRQYGSREEFVREVLGPRSVRRGVEVGVQEGLFSAELLRALPTLECLYLVDPWEHQASGYLDVANVPGAEQERRLASTRARLAWAGTRYQIVREFSPGAPRHMPEGSLDFVYLDGNHSAAATRADLAGWWPKLRSGGVMAGHDFTEGQHHGCDFGVVSAVQTFARELGVRAVWATDEFWASWWFFKD